MITSVAPVITSTGITAPTFADILAFLQAQYQQIFGADVYLGNDSQDGQLLAVFAQAMADQNAAAVATYNAFSPTSAQGVGLSSVVKINGLSRIAGAFATCQATIGGQANSNITSGVVTDNNQNQWTLPAAVEIPSGGSVQVTLTCTTEGDVGAPSSFTIATPAYGWQTATYVASSYIAGATVEMDAVLRVRQSNSVALPSLTIFEGILASILAVPGVTRAAGYENNTGSTNGDSIPAHSLAFVVEGGATLAVAQAINSKMPPGTSTYGTTSQVVTDSTGTSRTINFSRPTEDTVNIDVTVNPGTNWSTAAEAVITAALTAYIDALPIGVNVSYFGLLPTVLNIGSPYQGTYTVAAMTIELNSGGFGTSDLSIAWNAAPTIGTVNYST